ncbi:MAG: Y-family DNA polymerase [Pseudomonadales bacterium]|nr:Y-family DNA polymerase [Pseudomonadales bacterium]
MNPRLVALVDCNNFYASCERVFKPDLEGKPIVILSNNDGCIVARSNEAKALGIPMGAPLHLWKDLIQQHQIHVFSSNYALYGDLSRRVMRLLARYSPHQEIYSIDESFLDFTGMPHPVAHAMRLRHEIRKRTGIPVAVGIASTKTLAKLANFCAKKREPWKAMGVCNLNDLEPVALRELLSSIEVGEVWGVGYRSVKKLAALGLTTVEQLKTADAKIIRQHFSVVMERTVAELNGIACLEMEEIHPDKQQIVSSCSFGHLVTSLNELEASIASHVARGVEKLRGQGSVAALLTVFIQTNPFRTQDRQYSPSLTVSLVLPSDDVFILQKAANQALGQLYKPEYQYKKAGIMLSGILPNTVRQDDLFAPPPDAARQSLLKVLDQINRQYGRGAVKTATELLGKSWHMRQTLRSPRYTTCWEELLEVM